jgi:hypothetical protein
MKSLFKISLFAICLIAMSFAGQAQTVLISNGNGTGLDSVTNAGVKILSKVLTGYRETVTATIAVTKISGTLGGTIIPVGSDDGVNFHSIAQVTKDTVTVPNSATYTYGVSFQRGWRYYGIQWTGTGTMVGSFSGTLVARKTTD